MVLEQLFPWRKHHLPQANIVSAMKELNNYNDHILHLPSEYF